MEHLKGASLYFSLASGVVGVLAIEESVLDTNAGKQPQMSN
jgi:hypothetical protein